MGVVNDFIGKQRARDKYGAVQRVVQKYFGRLPRSFRSDLDAFAKHHSIEIFRPTRTAYEGMIERDEFGKATIYLRRGLNRRRERFTLAHEIGHWILQEELVGTMVGQLFRGVSRNQDETREEEALASLIAAEILMPFLDVFVRFDRQAPLTSVHRICNDFNVSRMAAVRRVADVTGMNLLLLQIVPYRLRDPASTATVDDAIYATARESTLFAPESTRLFGRPSFAEVSARTMATLRLASPKGEFENSFEIERRFSPIDHLFALSCVEKWPERAASSSVSRDV